VQGLRGGRGAAGRVGAHRSLSVSSIARCRDDDTLRVPAAVERVACPYRPPSTPRGSGAPPGHGYESWWRRCDGSPRGPGPSGQIRPRRTCVSARSSPPQAPRHSSTTISAT
jgi:hypothetical protein